MGALFRNGFPIAIPNNISSGSISLMHNRNSVAAATATKQHVPSSLYPTIWILSIANGSAYTNAQAVYGVAFMLKHHRQQRLIKEKKTVLNSVHDCVLFTPTWNLRMSAKLHTYRPSRYTFIWYKIKEAFYLYIYLFFCTFPPYFWITFKTLFI